MQTQPPATAAATSTTHINAGAAAKLHFGMHPQPAHTHNSIHKEVQLGWARPLADDHLVSHKALRCCQATKQGLQLRRPQLEKGRTLVQAITDEPRR